MKTIYLTIKLTIDEHIEDIVSYVDELDYIITAPGIIETEIVEFTEKE